MWQIYESLSVTLSRMDLPTLRLCFDIDCI